MAKKRTQLEETLGKLISAIQKEWGAELGEPHSTFSEDVMNKAHELLIARSPESMRKVLNGLSVQQFLGEVWLRKHPKVKYYVDAVEAIMK